MCYSARVQQNLHALTKLFGAEVAWDMIDEACRGRLEQDDVKVERALEQNFLQPVSEVERRIKAHIDMYWPRRTRVWETKIFA